MIITTHIHFAYKTRSIHTYHNRLSNSPSNHASIKGSRAPPEYTSKNRIRAGTRIRRHKTDPLLTKSVLPFHHTTLACTAQAEKGSSQNPHLILYKGELT